jgi:putative membrane protein
MTTRSTASNIPFRENRTLHRLCLAFGLWFLYTATRPEQVFDYWLENTLALTFIVVLAGTYRWLVLSELSYTLIFVFLCMHEWGAQYKYSDVPLGEWIKPIFATMRNHYDRVMHFSYGLLLAYPMNEWFERSAGARGGFRYLFPVQFTLACSAVYEMMEAGAAGILSPERGEEFVGMQGDPWDAQKDMFLAALGAVLACSVLAAVRARRGSFSLKGEDHHAARSVHAGRVD